MPARLRSDNVIRVCSTRHHAARHHRLAKVRSGQLSIASSGTGTLPHLAGELLKIMADIDILHTERFAY